MNIDVLKPELVSDPLERGYAAMNDVDAAASLNAADRDRNLSSLTASVVLNAIDKTEFNSLEAVDQRRVWDVIHMGDINPFGLEADMFIDAFGGGSATITALQGIRKESVSRATELNLGRVKPGHVEEARR